MALRRFSSCLPDTQPQCFHFHAAGYWLLGISTQVPKRSSFFWILTLFFLQRVSWHPARLLGEISGRACQYRATQAETRLTTGGLGSCAHSTGLVAMGM